jgi:hypothetical protein
MYFCKPADATVPLSGTGGDAAASSSQTPTPTVSTDAPAAAVDQSAQWTAPGMRPIVETIAPPIKPGPVPPPAAPPVVPPAPPTVSIIQATATAPVGLAPMPVSEMVPPDSALVQAQEPPSVKKIDNPKTPGGGDLYSTKLPPRDIVFRRRNDVELEKAIVEQIRKDLGFNLKDTSLAFPKGEKIGGDVAYVPKTMNYPPRQAVMQPLYVVHRRLLFEELNSDRYGWDLGFIQPIVSMAYFYKDVLLLTNNMVSGVAYGFYDTNAGKCSPGTPVPYQLYPPGLTITGTATETAVITGLAFLIHVP